MSALESVYVKNNEEEEEKGFQGRERDRKEAPSNASKEQRHARANKCLSLNTNWML